MRKRELSGQVVTLGGVWICGDNEQDTIFVFLSHCFRSYVAVPSKALFEERVFPLSDK